MAKRDRMITRIVVCVLAALCVLTGPARAQFFIEDGKVSLAVSGGDRINKKVIIHNTTAENISVRAYWEDFTYRPPFDGTKSFVPAGTGERSLSQWVSFSPSEFMIPPFGQQEINYNVSVPAVIDGGHYGVLFFEKVGDPARSQTGMDIVTRVGCLFFIEPKDLVKKAELRDIAVVSRKLTGVFVNQSPVVTIPLITYYFMDDQGVVADRGEVKKLYLPPDASGTFEIPLPAALSAAKYTVVVNADLENGNAIVKELEITRDAADNFTISDIRD